MRVRLYVFQPDFTGLLGFFVPHNRGFTVLVHPVVVFMHAINGYCYHLIECQPSLAAGVFVKQFLRRSPVRIPCLYTLAYISVLLLHEKGCKRLKATFYNGFIAWIVRHSPGASHAVKFGLEIFGYRGLVEGMVVGHYFKRKRPGIPYGILQTVQNGLCIFSFGYLIAYNTAAVGINYPKKI